MWIGDYDYSLGSCTLNNYDQRLLVLLFCVHQEQLISWFKKQIKKHNSFVLHRILTFIHTWSPEQLRSSEICPRSNGRVTQNITRREESLFQKRRLSLSSSAQVLLSLSTLALTPVTAESSLRNTWPQKMLPKVLPKIFGLGGAYTTHVLSQTLPKLFALCKFINFIIRMC